MVAEYSFSCAQTASFVRKALKREFHGVKFYVHSKNSSVRVYWKDGPTEKEVNSLVGIFASKDFDGSIDMACYSDHWLLPDGAVQIASSPGTAGSMGHIPAVDNKRPHPEAKRVRFGANFVFCSRAYSQELAERAAKACHQKTGLPIPPIEEYSWWVGGKMNGTTCGFGRGQWQGGSRPSDEWYSRELAETK